KGDHESIGSPPPVEARCHELVNPSATRVPPPRLVMRGQGNEPANTQRPRHLRPQGDRMSQLAATCEMSRPTLPYLRQTNGHPVGKADSRVGVLELSPRQFLRIKTQEPNSNVPESANLVLGSWNSE